MFIGHPGPVPPEDSTPRHQRSLRNQVTTNKKKNKKKQATTTTRATVTLITVAPAIGAILKNRKRLDRLMDYNVLDFNSWRPSGVCACVKRVSFSFVFISFFVFCQARCLLLGVALFLKKTGCCIAMVCLPFSVSNDLFLRKDTQNVFSLLSRLAVEYYFGPFVMARRSGLEGNCRLVIVPFWLRWRLREKERPSKGAIVPRKVFHLISMEKKKNFSSLDSFVSTQKEKWNGKMRQAGFHSFHSLPVTLNSELDSENSEHTSLSLSLSRDTERYWRLVSRRLSLTLEWLLIFFFYR